MLQKGQLEGVARGAAKGATRREARGGDRDEETVVGRGEEIRRREGKMRSQKRSSRRN